MHICVVHNEYGRFSGEEAVVEFMERLLLSHGHRLSLFVRSSAEIPRMWLGEPRAFFSGISGEDVEGREGRRGGHLQAGGFKDGFKFAGAYDGVDLGNGLHDFVPIALDEAAGDDELFRPTGGLVAGHL